MDDVYKKAFEKFKKELEANMLQIFLAPLPFTQVNRLSMLAATVAEEAVRAAIDGGALED